MELMNIGTFSPATDATASRRILDIVPDEIWVQIFLVSLERGERRRSNWNPFLLGVVCADWRRIALANSVLWDTVSVRFRNLDRKEEQFQTGVGALKIWIERARARPLSIEVNAFCLDSRSDVGQQIPKIIVAHASRIVSLSMCIFEKWRPFFRGVEFPQLHVLDLENTHLLDPTCDPLDFSRSSRLAVVKVKESFKMARVILPRPQIVEVGLSGTDYRGCLDVLNLLPNLERGYFNLGFECTNLTGNPQRRAATPSLTSLKLEEAHPTSMERILDPLPLTLRDLYLDIGNDSPYYECDGSFLLDYVPPFAGTLRSLTLCFSQQDSLAFRDLFPQLHGLEMLYMWSRDGNKGIYSLDCLTTAGVLPRLSYLRLRGFGDKLGNETIMAILRYRWHLAGERDCVKISDVQFRYINDSTRGWEKPLDPELKAELRSMIEGGLNLAIRYIYFAEKSLIWDD